LFVQALTPAGVLTSNQPSGLGGLSPSIVIPLGKTCWCSLPSFMLFPVSVSERLAMYPITLVVETRIRNWHRSNGVEQLLTTPSEQRVVCPICGYNAGTYNGEQFLKEHMLARHPGSNATAGGAGVFTQSMTADFLGWSPNHRGGGKTRLDLGKGELVVAELNPPLSIAYKDIEGIEAIPSKQTTTGRTFVAGPVLASSWKKMEWFLCIRYRDDAGIQLNLMFSPLSAEDLDGFILALYQKLRDAKRP